MAKPSTTTKAPKARVAGSDPDAMPQGGLIDDVDAVIANVRYGPWDYNHSPKMNGRYILGVRVEYEVEGLDTPYVQWYSTGAELDQFAPGDGTNDTTGEIQAFIDAGGDYDAVDDCLGIYAHALAKRDELPGGSNWGFWLQNLKGAGHKTFPPDVSQYEGLKVHLNQREQPKRAGVVAEEAAPGERKFAKTLLVVTEILTGGAKAKSTTTKPKATSKAAPVEVEETEAEGGSNEVDEQLSEAIVAAIAENGDELPTFKLTGIAVKLFKADPEAKAVAMARVKEVEFLEDSDLWNYDAKGKKLTAA